MNSILRKITLATALLLALLPLRVVAEQPRLVVQIVVGSMRPEDLTRYADHFTAGGFERLRQGGVHFTEASYNYQQTLTTTSLATLTTGALPTMHGVVGTHWYDYVDNRRIQLIDDPQVTGLEYYTGGGQFSPRHLIAPTVAESLAAYSPESRIVTIAMEPESAVVLGGKTGMTFWMNDRLCHWRSSSYYMPVLPEWVKRYNSERGPLKYLMQPWVSWLEDSAYRNERRADIMMQRPTKRRGGSVPAPRQFREISCDLTYRSNYDRLIYTPAGNSALFDFAKLAISQLQLGGDATPDLLNICLDAPSRIVQAYGPESLEAEDMYYRLDRELEDFLTYLFAQVDEERVVVVLTSDHGTSPSYDLQPTERERFNVPQFAMILESFLDARYGKGEEDWVLDCEQKMIYLNHNLIYEKRLSLAEVQNEVATFAMQFRGVSHALSSTAMRTSYFGEGYAEKMQNGFYPRRSGDVVLNLMPGWIEKEDRMRSMAGSMYAYDRRVPLIFYGWGVPTAEVEREVDLRDVASTVARILGVSAPAAAEGSPLDEVFEAEKVENK